jgi:sugar phosphate isomerase/epimerase
MHVKDIQSNTHPNTALQQNPTEVGSGIIPWPRILPAALQSGVHHFFIEQEPPFPGPRLDSVRKSFNYLNHLPG